MKRCLAWLVAGITAPFILGYAATWAAVHAANTYILTGADFDDC